MLLSAPLPLHMPSAVEFSDGQLVGPEEQPGMPRLKPQAISLSLGLGVRRPGLRAATGGFQDRLGRMSRWMRGACPCSPTALSTRSS